MTDFDTISEIILYVQDMERMISFYEDAFDLEITGGHPDHGFVEFETSTCTLCLHAGSDGDIGRAAPTFVFAVDDVEAAKAHLQDKGVEMGEIRTPTPNVTVCDGRDPEGNRFSIESS